MRVLSSQPPYASQRASGKSQLHIREPSLVTCGGVLTGRVSIHLSACSSPFILSLLTMKGVNPCFRHSSITPL